MPDDLSDLIISVGGDIAPLQSALDQIPAAAQQAAAGVASAIAPLGEEFHLFDKSIGEVSSSLAGLYAPITQFSTAVGSVAPGLSASGAASQVTAQAFTAMGTAATGASQATQAAAQAATGAVPPLQQIAATVQQGAQAAQQALPQFNALTGGIQNLTAAAGAGGVGQFPPLINQLGGAASGAVPPVASLTESLQTLVLQYITFQALKRAAEEMVEAFGQFERAGIAMRVLSGDAAGAAVVMDNVRATADRLGVSMDNILVAQKRLASADVPLANLPHTLEAIANSAAAMNVNFESVAARFDQLVMTGMILGRTLTSLHLTLPDLAEAMGMAGASAQVVRDSFKGIAEESVRAEVLSRAMLTKTPQLAEEMATGVTGSWNRIKNASHEAWISLGEDVDGFKGLADSVLVVIHSLETAWFAMTGQVKIAVDFVLVAVNTLLDSSVATAKAARDILAGDWAGAIADAAEARTRIGSYMQSLPESIRKDFQDAGDAIGKVWSGASDGAAKASSAIIGSINASGMASGEIIEGTILPAIAKVDKAADSAAKKIETWNESFRTTAQRALDAFAAMDDGGKTAGQAVSALSNVIETASLHTDKMRGASNAMLEQVKSALVEAKQAETDAANNDALNKIVDQMSNLEIKAAELADRVPTNFADMMAGIEQGVNFTGLERQLTGELDKLTTALARAKADLSAGVTVDIDVGGLQAVVDKTEDARLHLLDMLAAMKLIGQDRSMNLLAADIRGLVNEWFEGEVSASKFSEGVTNIGAALFRTVIPAMERGIAVTPELLAVLRSLGPVGQEFADALGRGLDAALVSLTRASEDIRAKALTIDTAFKDLNVVSFDAAQASVTRYSHDVVKALGDISEASNLTVGQLYQARQAVIAFGERALPDVKLGVAVDQSAIDSIAKIAPAFAAAISQGPAAMAQALANLKAVNADTFLDLDQAYATFGEKSTDVLNRLAEHQQNALDVMQASGAPLQAQLVAYQKILETQIALGEQQGADTSAQVIRLVNVNEQLKVMAEKSQGIGLLWKDLVDIFDKSFDTLSRGLADAIVNAKSFGDAMLGVLKRIETEILNALIGFALRKFKEALVDVFTGGGTGGGGVLGTTVGAAGGAAGTIGGGASSTATTVAQAKAVAEFTASTTIFESAVNIFQSAVTMFNETATRIEEAIIRFDDAVLNFADSVFRFEGPVLRFDSAVVRFEEAVSRFDGATLLFNSSVQEFATAVQEFAQAQRTSGGGIGGFLGAFAGAFVGGLIGIPPVGAGVPPVQEGADFVPKTGLYMLHEGEKVIPAGIDIGTQPAPFSVPSADSLRGPVSVVPHGQSQGQQPTPVPASVPTGLEGGSAAQSDGGVHFHNCQFSGVTQSLVDDVMNRAVKSVRRIGGKL